MDGIGNINALEVFLCMLFNEDTSSIMYKLSTLLLIILNGYNA